MNSGGNTSLAEGAANKPSSCSVFTLQVQNRRVGKNFGFGLRIQKGLKQLNLF